MRTVKDQDVETAYSITADISDAAKSLFLQGKWDPFHIEILWADADSQYDISIDVAIKKKSDAGYPPEGMK